MITDNMIDTAPIEIQAALQPPRGEYWLASVLSLTVSSSATLAVFNDEPY